MKQQEFQIRDALAEDMGDVERISIANKSQKDPTYWDLCKMRMDSKELSVFVAETPAKEIVGYGLLNWKPKYRLYENLNIPEIQDLNVLPEYRRRGIAKALIRECEEKAAVKGHQEMGISFGLTKEYGYAQKLYISLGYVPDGFGVTYDREPVPHGQLKAVDDNLCLMLIKKLTACPN